mmetsp:Transcript_148184/g.270024  ORF Transcript_148184/g.270024 Transcript_148184/m.270024 type:complete len:496 (+) Transcript_148184:99-1586(+)
MYLSLARPLVYSVALLANVDSVGHALQVQSEAFRSDQDRSQTRKTKMTKVLSDSHGGTYWSGQLATATVQHPTEDCYSACGNKSGYCNWCGEGNACCRLDLKGAEECSRSKGFTTDDYHECVGVEKENQQKPTLTWQMLDRFILVPEHNLLFCYIEKVACTSFNDLFAGLRKRYDPTMIHTRKVQGWFQNDPYHRGYTKEDIEDILVNRSWHKAVFYRDPVERFVSAYRSKCEGQDTDGTWVCAESFGSPVASFPLAVERMKEIDERNDPEEEFKMNVHLRRQSSFCGGLQDTLKYYNTVEPLEKSTARSKVIKLLEDVGANHTWVANFDELFPPEDGTANAILQDANRTQQKEHNTNTLEHLKEYFDARHPDSLDVLVSHYKDDYATFELPVPIWRKSEGTEVMSSETSTREVAEEENAARDVDNSASASSMKELEEDIFHSIDKDQSGAVTLEEFENYFEEDSAELLPAAEILENAHLPNNLVLSQVPLQRFH